MNEKPLLTTQQLADHIEVPARTLTNWRYRGEGPTWTKLGRHIRYRWADIEKWLDSQAQGGTA